MVNSGIKEWKIGLLSAQLCIAGLEIVFGYGLFLHLGTGINSKLLKAKLSPSAKGGMQFFMKHFYYFMENGVHSQSYIL